MSEINCLKSDLNLSPDMEKHVFTVFYIIPVDEFERDLLYLRSDQSAHMTLFTLPRSLGVRAQKGMKLEYLGHFDNRPETATVILKDVKGQMLLKFKKIKPKKYLEEVKYQKEFPISKPLARQIPNLISKPEKTRS